MIAITTRTSISVNPRRVLIFVRLFDRAGIAVVSLFSRTDADPDILPICYVDSKNKLPVSLCDVSARRASSVYREEVQYCNFLDRRDVETSHGMQVASRRRHGRTGLVVSFATLPILMAWTVTSKPEPCDLGYT